MRAREVIYYDVSPFAALSAQATTGNNVASFSEPERLFKENQVFRSIQTCENNYTVLDGTHSAFGDSEDEPENIALWSRAQSLHPSRELPGVVELDVRFGGLQSSPGIAFYFDRDNNNYCDWLSVSWYRGGALVSAGDFRPTGPVYSCVRQVEHYDRVRVRFRRLNMPHRYLRVEAVIFGIVRFFSDDSLEGLMISEGADPSGRSVYINSAHFTVNTQDPVPYLFLKRQPIQIKYGGGLVGVYYIDKSKKLADRRYSIEAVDKIGVLDNTDEFLGGMYYNTPAGTIIRAIVGGIFDVNVDASLENVPVTGWLPILKKRAALAQVALAVGAVVDASRTGEIKIRRMPEQLSKLIGRERVYAGGSVDIAFPYTGIELIEHNYTVGAEAEDLFKDTFTGQKLVKFRKPASNLSISGGVIIEMGVNYARISSTGGGECVLRGRPFIDNQNSVIIRTGDLVEGTQEKIEKIERCWLVNRRISREVAQRLYNYYLRQHVFKGDILLDLDELERVGDVVRVATGFEDDITGQIEKLALSFGHKNIKARGVIRGN